MKMKNSLALVAGSLIAVVSTGAFAQGQGAVEGEAFVKRYFTDSARHMDNGQLYGGSLGYFLTDDVSLALSYGEYHDIRGDNEYGNKNIKGSLTSLDAYYHFAQPGDWVRPYISTGVAHQSISNADRSGRDRDTILNLGVGAKLYFTDNFYARAGVDGMYGLGNHQAEYMLTGAVGFNFGGGKKVEPAPEPVVVEPTPEPEIVRVQLDVKFDFDKATIREGSYDDIKQVADFMKQFPQTTTVVEGHTDSVGAEAYNQKLSEERANAVRNALVDTYGVEGSRVQAVGYGEDKPIADNASKEGRAMNRRVDATVEAQVIPPQETATEQAQ
ncbi:OmpA family protein [Entomomonas sp. E2T0]|uniref:OmpA family protein n=1 Tax=Entomomonas sp. E2T0 TaxID=2930213 RepID=UPI0022283212|nr:OmpA family protein [Entomomonas sp. E2T0]UYZ84428.1 OmpA family protein [Entomomonas sp. E2T0]